MDLFVIYVLRENNVITIYNNGKGIPVVDLLTSFNYSEEEEKVTAGGPTVYSAKLCNIFSTSFKLLTAEEGIKFEQTWSNNMNETTEPKLAPFSGSDFTQIKFSPDLAKFKVNSHYIISFHYIKTTWKKNKKLIT